MVGEGEAVEGDREQREGGEDAGDGAAPDRVQIHAGRHGRVQLQYQ